MFEQLMDTSGTYQHSEELDFSLVAEFEQKLDQLQPYDDPTTLVLKFPVHGFELTAEKFIPAVLWKHDGDFDILLGCTIQSGYEQLAHETILLEHRLEAGPTEAYRAFVFTAGNKRYLIVGGLKSIQYEERETLSAALQQYNISLSFSLDETGEQPNPLDNTAASGTDDYLHTLKRLLYDSWTRQVAKNYGLTNYEWFRFRITKKLSPDQTVIKKTVDGHSP